MRDNERDHVSDCDQGLGGESPSGPDTEVPRSGDSVVSLLSGVYQLRHSTPHIRRQIPVSLLENKQRNRVLVLHPVDWQRYPKPGGLLRHVDHVQGSYDGTTKCSAQI